MLRSRHQACKSLHLSHNPSLHGAGVYYKPLRYCACPVLSIAEWRSLMSSLA